MKSKEDLIMIGYIITVALLSAVFILIAFLLPACGDETIQPVPSCYPMKDGPRTVIKCETEDLPDEDQDEPKSN